MKSPYKTKQREDIISYLGTTGGRHFTAADICRHFQERGRPIGTATVYRQLEKLVDEGQVKKYALSDGGSACDEYIDPENNCCRPVCYHRKCQVCGRLIHMECREITQLEQHLLSRHGFRIDPARTVFYGVCAACGGKEPVQI